MGASAVIAYLLDANVVSYWLERSRPALLPRLKQHRHACAQSAVALFEGYFGAFNGTRPVQSVALYDEVPFPVLPFEREDARGAGEIRAVLRRAGTPIGPYDILIAGQALARDLTLVTNNVREFARVPGLKLADWTAG